MHQAIHHRAVYDDDVVTLAFLHSQMAMRFLEEPLGASMGNVGMDLSETLPTQVEEERPPSVADSVDEDPFGHLLSGFDCHWNSVRGHTAGQLNPSDEQSSNIQPDSGRPLLTAEQGAAAQRDTREMADCATSDCRVHSSHRLRKSALVVGCLSGGRSATSRIGSGPVRPCRGVAEGAYPKRVMRLKSSLRPLSGMPLHEYAHLL